MANETIVQSSLSDPAFKQVAEQIIAITSRMREDSHDQETIRTALHAFAQACAGGGPQSVPSLAVNSSRY